MFHRHPTTSHEHTPLVVTTQSPESHSDSSLSVAEQQIQQQPRQQQQHHVQREECEVNPDPVPQQGAIPHEHSLNLDEIDQSYETHTFTRMAPGKPKRLGVKLKLLISIAFFVLVIVILFLSWVWWADEGWSVDEKWELWRLLVTSPHLPTSITLASLLARTAVGILDAAATSMIASIIVESQGVSLERMAEVSIARFNNGGPRALYKLILSTGTLGIMIFLLLVTTTASQFTSTLLVNDLDLTVVQSFPRQTPNAFTIVQDERPMILSGQNPQFSYLVRKPTASEIFAEYSESVELRDGIEDTGPTIRALLPIPLQSDRQAVSEFRGMARVLDARTVCLRPKITNVRFCTPLLTNSVTHLCGDLDFDKPQLENIHLEQTSGGAEPDTTLQLRCPFTSPNDAFPNSKSLDYVWSMCPIFFGSLVTSLTNDTSAGESTHKKAWVVWRSKILSPQTGIQLPFDRVWNQLNVTNDGPWTNLWSRVSNSSDGEGAYREGTFEVEIQMSVCFEAVSSTHSNTIDHLPIVATSRNNLTEPRYQWNNDTGNYNTNPILNQLGAVVGGGIKREILTITPVDMEASLATVRGKPIQPPTTEAFEWFHELITFFRSTDPNTLAFCPRCAADVRGYHIVDTLLSAIFTDIINETNSPSLAVQAFMTITARMAYYDFIDTFSASGEEATITTFESVLAPMTSSGYCTVMAVFAVHIVIFLLCSWMFWKGVKSSVLDSAWPTIGQVSGCAEASRALAVSILGDDDQVEDVIKGRGSATGVMDKVKRFIGAAFTWSRGRRFVVRDGVFVPKDE